MYVFPLVADCGLEMPADGAWTNARCSNDFFWNIFPCLSPCSLRELPAEARTPSLIDPAVCSEEKAQHFCTIFFIAASCASWGRRWWGAVEAAVAGAKLPSSHWVRPVLNTPREVKGSWTSWYLEKYILLSNGLWCLYLATCLKEGVLYAAIFQVYELQEPFFLHFPRVFKSMYVIW